MLLKLTAMLLTKYILTAAIMFHFAQAQELSPPIGKRQTTSQKKYIYVIDVMRWQTLYLGKHNKKYFKYIVKQI